jgi:transposase
VQVDGHERSTRGVVDDDVPVVPVHQPREPLHVAQDARHVRGQPHRPLGEHGQLPLEVVVVDLPLRRQVDGVPRNRGTVLTMLGALMVDGLETVMTNIGATTGDVFFRFVRDHLVAVLKDRLAAHFRSDAVALIREAGAEVLYLPPYSPDYNPIELAWSKLKNTLRKLGARTVTQLQKAIEDAMLDITPSDATNWSSHRGYRAQPA